MIIIESLFNHKYKATFDEEFILLSEEEQDKVIKQTHTAFRKILELRGKMEMESKEFDRQIQETLQDLEHSRLYVETKQVKEPQELQDDYELE